MEYKAHISSLNSTLLSDHRCHTSFCFLSGKLRLGTRVWKEYLAKELLMLKYAQMGERIKAI